MIEIGERQRLHFSHAYGYAAAISQMLRRPEGRSEIGEWIDITSETFRASLQKPEKRSVLHDIIMGFGYHDWGHEVSHWRLHNVEQLFLDHGEPFPRPRGRGDGSRDKLERQLERPLEKLTSAAVHLLFGDRTALLAFNEVLAGVIRNLPREKFPELQSTGMIRRPTYIPTWLKRAVYHRDKGRCQLCHRDLRESSAPSRMLSLITSGRLHCSAPMMLRISSYCVLTAMEPKREEWEEHLKSTMRIGSTTRAAQQSAAVDVR